LNERGELDRRYERRPMARRIAVVRSNPPRVFLAASEAVLTRLVALELVAQSSPSDIHDAGVVHDIRAALLEERWADAIVDWMNATGETVDAYPDELLRTERTLDEEAASLEIRLAPIFVDR
jgi:hypothetical protein